MRRGGPSLPWVSFSYLFLFSHTYLNSFPSLSPHVSLTSGRPYLIAVRLPLEWGTPPATLPDRGTGEMGHLDILPLPCLFLLTHLISCNDLFPLRAAYTLLTLHASSFCHLPAHHLHTPPVSASSFPLTLHTTSHTASPVPPVLCTHSHTGFHCRLGFFALPLCLLPATAFLCLLSPVLHHACPVPAYSLFSCLSPPLLTCLFPTIYYVFCTHYSHTVLLYCLSLTYLPLFYHTCLCCVCLAHTTTCSHRLSLHTFFSLYNFHTLQSRTLLSVFLLWRGVWKGQAQELFLPHLYLFVSHLFSSSLLIPLALPLYMTGGAFLTPHTSPQELEGREERNSPSLPLVMEVGAGDGAFGGGRQWETSHLLFPLPLPLSPPFPLPLSSHLPPCLLSTTYSLLWTSPGRALLCLPSLCPSVCLPPLVAALLLL